MNDPRSDDPQTRGLSPTIFHGSVAGILVYAIAFTDHVTAFFDARLDWIHESRVVDLSEEILTILYLRIRRSIS